MMKRQKKNEILPALVHRTSIKVRFSEVDSMGIVWHGEYIRYFEDGREDFGKQYGLGYADIYNNGYMAPIVDIQCHYKHSMTFGEEAIVETRYIPLPGAKIHFEYIIYKADGKTVVASGSTTQVFLNANKELELVCPLFYQQWKEKWKI